MDNRSVSESAVRNHARRVGYSVRKARQGIGADNCGDFMLVETRRNICVLGNRYDATLQEISEYLAD